MIRIKIPDNNQPEREYSIRIILTDILGLDYSIILANEESNYVMEFDDREIIVEDGFFGNYSFSLSYLCTEALPKKVVFAKNDFTVENDIPVIYGTDKLIIENNKILCGIDIFASSFFMLTRWEEHVNKRRDEHNRFPGRECIAYRNNFLHRPVVNEYAEMLWNMLKKSGYGGQRRNRNFELILTHDVDALTYVSYRTIVGDILKRGNLKLAAGNSKYLLSQDPFDTFDFLMTMSEGAGVKSHFYFMSSDSRLEYDTGFYIARNKFKSTIKKIKSRGHIIGFHPGYYTFDDPARWHYEKKLLEEAIQQEIAEGRQHYLRMDLTKTLLIWEENNMKMDSTLGYADKEGFRCGTGNQFAVFNILERKQLRLKERPLILMDGTLRQYREYSKDQVLDIIGNYISIGKRYRTIITLLFHNSSFFREWQGYDSVYREVLSIGS